MMLDWGRAVCGRIPTGKLNYQSGILTSILKPKSRLTELGFNKAPIAKDLMCPEYVLSTKAFC